MSIFKRNLISVYSVNFINGLAGFAFIPLALKGLGAEGYGIYSIFVILTSYIFFVEMGVAKYFTRSIAQTLELQIEKKEMQTAVGIYIRIAILLILLTPILLYVIPKFLFPIDGKGLFVEKIVLLCVIDYLLSIPVAVLLTFNTGKEKFLKISRYNLISGLSKHLFLIGGVLIFKSVLPIIFIVLIRRIFDIFYAFKYLDPLPIGAWMPNYQKGEFLKVISQSILLSAAQLSQVTVLAVGTYLVNKNFTLVELGIYKAAFDMSTKVWFLSNGLGLVIFPRFAALIIDKDNKTKLLGKLMFYIQVSFIAYNLFFLIAVLILPYISSVLLIRDLILFSLLLFGVCLNAHSNLSYEFLQASSKLKEVIVINLVSLLIIIVGFHLLVGTFNLRAIAISWVISQFVYGISMDFMTLKDAGIKKASISILINLFVFISVGIMLLYLI